MPLRPDGADSAAGTVDDRVADAQFPDWIVRPIAAAEHHGGKQRHGPQHGLSPAESPHSTLQWAANKNDATARRKPLA
jgi:hypothetical protein